jgi:hypothetical protein
MLWQWYYKVRARNGCRLGWELNPNVFDAMNVANEGKPAMTVDING